MGSGQVFDFSISGASTHPSNAVASIDGNGNPTQTYYDPQGSAVYTLGCSGSCRWGDFNSVLPDPTNSSAWWTAGMWAAAGGGWSTWVAQIGI